jgi:steroid 5-alpha reductase family enzyme
MVVWGKKSRGCGALRGAPALELLVPLVSEWSGRHGWKHLRKKWREVGDDPDRWVPLVDGKKEG